jgi:hypothetical protein
MRVSKVGQVRLSNARGDIVGDGAPNVAEQVRHADVQTGEVVIGVPSGQVQPLEAIWVNVFREPLEIALHLPDLRASTR